MKSSAIVFAVLALLAGGASGLANAAPAAMTVTTHDLDLTTAAGRTALDRRVRMAAAELCGEASASDPAGRRAVRACRHEAVVRARQQLALTPSLERLAAR